MKSTYHKLPYHKLLLLSKTLTFKKVKLQFEMVSKSRVLIAVQYMRYMVQPVHGQEHIAQLSSSWQVHLNLS